MIAGTEGPVVVLSARTAAWLEQYAQLTRVRVYVRGTDRAISRELEEIRQLAMAWRGSAPVPSADSSPEPVARSERLTTGQAATLLGVTSRAVVKAIARGAIPSVRDDANRHLLSREDIEQYRAAQAA